MKKNTPIAAIKNSIYLVALCMTQPLMSMETSIITVQLQDKSTHDLALNEMQTSATLLKKQIERDKTTVDLVKKWGHSEHDYETFQQKPLNLSHINNEQFSLFKQFLTYDQKTWPKKFRKLMPHQQDTIHFITSDQGLGVSLFLAHLAQIIVPKEAIQAHIGPYLETKDIVSYLRSCIIVHNAQHTTMPQTTQSLEPHETTIQFNDVFNQCMRVPSSVIKNKSYRFCGGWDNPEIMLEGVLWQLYVIKYRSDGLTYIITPSFCSDKIDHDFLHNSPENTFFMWLIDKDKNIVDKKSILYKGHLQYLTFSPNAHYLAISTKQSEAYPHNTFSLLKINPAAAVVDYDIIHSSCPDPRITALCFNKKSTIVATGTKGDDANKNIILWDAHTVTELSFVCNIPGKIKRLCFNNRDTQMIAFLANNDNPDLTDSTVMIFDVTNPTQITTTVSHNIPFDSMRNPHLSPNDALIEIKLLNGYPLFIDGMTGKIINDTTMSYGYYPLQRASAFYADDTLVVSAFLTGYGIIHGSAYLWDAQKGERLANLIPKQADLSGIGFSSDKRHVVATVHGEDVNNIITIELFDQTTHSALTWLKRDTSLLQKYALYWIYKAHQNKISEGEIQLPHIIQSALSSLPDNACNAQKIIKQHLIS